MGSVRYRFHCTNGHDAVFDTRGRLVAGASQLRRRAEQVARAVMACDATLDWTDWIVDVHDARGRRRLVLAFVDPRNARPEAQDRARSARR